MAARLGRDALVAAIGVALGAVATYTALGAGSGAQPPSAGRKPPVVTAPPPAPRPGLPPLSEQARQIVKYGVPGADNHIISREGYVVAYDRRLRNPLWVLEHLTATTLKGEATRTESHFKEDPSVPAMFRAKLADYVNSGFDRGHMVPAGDNKTSQKAMDDTFFLTNISPQVGAGFNRNYWSRFEQFVRNLTKDYADVYVITGPLYLPQRAPDGKHYVHFQMIGEPPNVAVPTHFYKVILAERAGERYATAFVMANTVIDDAVPLQQFETPLDQVERHAGLIFFDMIDRATIAPLCRQSSCHLPSADFYKNKPERRKSI